MSIMHLKIMRNKVIKINQLKRAQKYMKVMQSIAKLLD